MKNILLLLTALFITCSLFSQDYKVGFTASGLSTEMDSVEIINLTQDKSITVYGQDTLHLLGVVGLAESLKSKAEIKLYPNPAAGQTQLEYNSSQGGTAKLMISDISGKRLFTSQLEAQPGTNRIRISGFQRGTYLLSLNHKHTMQTRKLTVTAGSSGNLKAEISAATNKEVSKKSVKAENLVEWQYDEGDILLFKGWSMHRSRIMVYYINSDVNLNFEFVQCQDPDGNHYTVTTINGVTWMAENLKTSKYNNNVPIPNLTDTADWNNTTEGARCYFYNDSAFYAEEFGALYNYAAANHGDLCPFGWHVPTQSEFEDLMIFLQNNGYNYDGTSDSDNDTETNNKIAKALSATYSFNNGDVEGSPGNYDYLSYRNRSGFSALAAGTRTTTNNYANTHSRDATFWTTTEWVGDPDAGMRIETRDNRVDTRVLFSNKLNGYSIRCIMD
ncbi:MAG TPA: FISUMP domain-containing protein [Bacteroidales bacterium]|nr:FISUMP domain-containing protein [Bacteroidales bacterium]